MASDDAPGFPGAGMNPRRANPAKAKIETVVVSSIEPVGLDSHGRLELSVTVQGRTGTVYVTEDEWRTMGGIWNKGCP